MTYEMSIDFREIFRWPECRPPRSGDTMEESVLLIRDAITDHFAAAEIERIEFGLKNGASISMEDMLAYAIAKPNEYPNYIIPFQITARFASESDLIAAQIIR